MGRSGLKVSEISLGGWCLTRGKFDDNEVSLLLSESLERGVNLIDLADIYGGGETEAQLGKLLRGYPRHQLVLATKSYWPMSQGVNDSGLSRKHIFESVQASLRRLQTDYLDLFYCHRFDDETPLEETVSAIGDLIRQGKILYWGVCGWSEAQLSELIQICKQCSVPPPIAHQLLYNLLERGAERKPLSVSAQHGLGVVAWSPLAGGALARPLGERLTIAEREERRATWIAPWSHSLEATSQESSGPLADQSQGSPKASLQSPSELNHEHHELLLTRLHQLAKNQGMSAAQLSIAWILRRTEVSSVTTEVSSVDQLRENLESSRDPISNETWATLDSIFEL